MTPRHVFQHVTRIDQVGVIIGEYRKIRHTANVVNVRRGAKIDVDEARRVDVAAAEVDPYLTIRRARQAGTDERSPNGL